MDTDTEPKTTPAAGCVFADDGRIYRQTPAEEVEVMGADYTPPAADPEAQELDAARAALATAQGIDATAAAFFRLQQAERAAADFAARYDDARDAFKRDSEFIAHTKNRAGEILTKEAAEKSRSARALLHRQTVDLAVAITGEGIPAFLPPSAPRASIVCPVTRQRLDLTPVRRINFFPTIAQARRAPMVAHLEKFVEDHPETQLVTFTYGPRVVVPLPDFLPATATDAERREMIQTSAAKLRAAVAEQHRRLSRLNHGATFTHYGFRLHFRATEFGEVKASADGLSLHIHSHCFASFAEPPSDSDKTAFIKSVWVEWPAHWDFGKTIHKAREACKYPVKPGDLERITNAGAAIIYHALRGMRLVTPMGALKPIIRQRFASASKLRRWRQYGGENDGALILKARPDWNSRARDIAGRTERARAAAKRREAEKARAFVGWIAAAAAFDRAAAAHHAAQAAEARLLARLAMSRPRQAQTDTLRATAGQKRAESRRLARLGLFLARLQPRPAVEVAWLTKRAEEAAARKLRQSQPPPYSCKNRIVARLGSAHYFEDRISRPGLFVWEFDGDFDALAKREFMREYVETVAPIVAKAREQLPEFDAAEAEKKSAKGSEKSDVSPYTESTPVTQLPEHSYLRLEAQK